MIGKINYIPQNNLLLFEKKNWHGLDFVQLNLQNRHKNETGTKVLN